MHTKQTIIIIGASSELGSFIAKGLSRGHYRLLLNDKDKVRLNELREEILEKNSCADAEAIDCSFEGCWEADIIIWAVSSGDEKEVADRIREVANQKIVVSFNTNVEGNNEELQTLLPNSKVVNVAIKEFESSLQLGEQQADALIFGNDVEALQTVAELLTTAGFSVDAKCNTASTWLQGC